MGGLIYKAFCYFEIHKCMIVKNEFKIDKQI